MILGHFNPCGGTDNSTLSQEMHALHQIMPQVDCRSTTPPNVSEIVHTWKRPLVFVGMFDTSRTADDHAVRHEIDSLGQSVQFVDTRAIVESLPRTVFPSSGAQQRPTICLSGKRFVISDCVPDHDNANVTLHTCTGPYGGHADMVAWQTQQVVWDLLEQQETLEREASG